MRPSFQLHNFFDRLQPSQKWQEVKKMTEILDKEFLDRTANRDLPGSNDEKAEELEDIALAIEMLAERIKSLTEGTGAESYAYRYVTGHMAADHFGILGEGVAERIRKAARMLEP